MPSRYLVSPSEYDDIGAVLSEFGQGFEFDACSWEDLCRARVIRGYEVVYLNCARQFEDAAFRARLAPVLREFVNDGGTVYASDWALTVVCEAFPGRLGINLVGKDGDFSCLVGDRGLHVHADGGHEHGPRLLHVHDEPQRPHLVGANDWRERYRRHRADRLEFYLGAVLADKRREHDVHADVLRVGHRRGRR